MFNLEQLIAWVAAGQLALPLAVLGVFAAWEAVRPERSRELGRRWRWVTNLGLEIASHVLMRWVALYAITVAALKAVGSPQANVFESIHHAAGPWVVLVAACVLLDFLSYLVHRLEHAVFPLWCLHAVHHADVDVDASTAVRHHPLEVLVTSLLLLPLILVLGLPLWVLPIYGLLVQIAQVAQHANWRLPERAEALLSLLLVTPGFHRAHHATAVQHHDTNFGTVLSVWDHFFSTTGPRLLDGSTAPAFGLADYRDQRFARPDGALLLPFVILRDRMRDRMGSDRPLSPDLGS